MRFSLPTIISLLVSALYNIIDQIFIGHGVGFIGNGATNVIFPLMTISMAFAFMTGAGGAAYFSIKLGEKDEVTARKAVENSVFLLVVFGITIGLVSSIFLKPICSLFGATDAIMPYSLAYGRIITMGLPIFIVGLGLNSILRADGSPAYSMHSMMLGAIINVVLDPIFIFVFKMGVQGAAIATVLGQIATLIFSVSYLFKFKHFSLNFREFKPDFEAMKKSLTLGTSSFITQVSIMIVIVTFNNLLVHYGAQSKYGAEIPLTVLGIVMKVYQILIAIFVGFAIGSQPIVGYNYGAKNYDRVLRTFSASATAATIVSVIGFIVFFFFPQYVIALFGSENPLYVEFAITCFRTFLLLCAVNGFQIVSGIFFQSIGHPKEAAFLSLSRQIIFLLPPAFILPHFLGVKGILWAGPVGDGISFLVALVMVLVKIARLKREEKERGDLTEIAC